MSKICSMSGPHGSSLNMDHILKTCTLYLAVLRPYGRHSQACYHLKHMVHKKCLISCHHCASLAYMGNILKTCTLYLSMFWQYGRQKWVPVDYFDLSISLSKRLFLFNFKMFCNVLNVDSLHILIQSRILILFILLRIN